MGVNSVDGDALKKPKGCDAEGKAERRPYNPPRSPDKTPAQWWKSGKCSVESPLPPGKNLKARLCWNPYDSIESGEKREEYREGAYWVDRLVGREIGSMTFFRGQDGPQMTWEVVGIIREDDDFEIQLGKRLA